MKTKIKIFLQQTNETFLDFEDRINKFLDSSEVGDSCDIEICELQRIFVVVVKYYHSTEAKEQPSAKDAVNLKIARRRRKRGGN